MEFVSKEKNDLSVVQVDVILHCKCGMTLSVDMQSEISHCQWYPEDVTVALEVTCPACKRVYEKESY